MKYPLFIVLLLWMTSMMAVMPASNAFAQQNPKPPTSMDAQAEMRACLSLDKLKYKYSGKAIYCMQELIEKATYVITEQVVTKYALPALGALVVLAVSVFGIKTAGGMFRNMKAEGFIFLIKLGFIIGIMTHMEIVIAFWFGAVDTMIEIVADAKILAGRGGCAKTSSDLGKAFIVWDHFDCLFGKFVGFMPGNLVELGVLALAGAAMSAGGLGIWLFPLALAALFVMANFLFHAMMMVLLSYGGLALMLVLFPLFLPLILFKVTQNFFFDSWLRFATGYVLQPGMTIVILMFGLLVMDKVIESGSSTTYTFYNKLANSSIVRSFQEGQKIPPGYEKSFKAVGDIMGITPKDSTAEIQRKAREAYKTVKSEGGGKLMTDANVASYQKQNCGNLGNATPSGGVAADAVPDKAWQNCKDPAKCKAAAQSGFAAAPNKVGMKQYLCNLGKTTPERMKTQGHNAQKGGIDMSSDSHTELQIGETSALHDKGIMDLSGSVVAVMIMALVWFSFIKNVPKIVSTISGVPGQKMSLASPNIAGHSLSTRFQKGVKHAVDTQKELLAKSFSKNKSSLNPLATKGGMGEFAQRSGVGMVKAFFVGAVNPGKVSAENYSIRQLTKEIRDDERNKELAKQNQPTRQTREEREKERKEQEDKTKQESEDQRNKKKEEDRKKEDELLRKEEEEKARKREAELKKEAAKQQENARREREAEERRQKNGQRPEREMQPAGSEETFKAPNKGGGGNGGKGGNQSGEDNGGGGGMPPRPVPPKPSVPGVPITKPLPSPTPQKPVVVTKEDKLILQPVEERLDLKPLPKEEELELQPLKKPVTEKDRKKELAELLAENQDTKK